MSSQKPEGIQGQLRWCRSELKGTGVHTTRWRDFRSSFPPKLQTYKKKERLGWIVSRKRHVCANSGRGHRVDPAQAQGPQQQVIERITALACQPALAGALPRQCMHSGCRQHLRVLGRCRVQRSAWPRTAFGRPCVRARTHTHAHKRMHAHDAIALSAPLPPVHARASFPPLLTPEAPVSAVAGSSADGRRMTTMKKRPRNHSCSAQPKRSRRRKESARAGSRARLQTSGTGAPSPKSTSRSSRSTWAAKTAPTQRQLRCRWMLRAT